MATVHIEKRGDTQTFLTLENELISMTLFLPKGGEIIGLTHKATGTQLIRQVEGYQEAYERILASEGNYEDNFLNEYTTGGWFEMFPHAGGIIEDDRSGSTVHGELRYRPFVAEILSEGPDEVVVRLTAEGIKVPWKMTRTISLSNGDPSFTLKEKAENTGDAPLPIMWGHHITFGMPFIEGAEIDCPATTIIANKTGVKSEYPTWEGIDVRTTMPPSPEGFRMMFLTGFSEGWYTITNPSMHLSIRVEFDKELFPVVWYWNTRGGTDNLHDSFAMEPVSGVPYALDQNRMVLEEEKETEIKVTVG